jgi:hypothetical protein
VDHGATLRTLTFLVSPTQIPTPPRTTPYHNSYHRPCPKRHDARRRPWKRFYMAYRCFVADLDHARPEVKSECSYTRVASKRERGREEEEKSDPALAPSLARTSPIRSHPNLQRPLRLICCALGRNVICYCL